MRVAVLGGPTGRGRRVLRDLLETPEVSTVRLVGPAERELARLIGAFDPRRVDAAVVPATVEGIAGALDGANVAVSCLEDRLDGPGQPHGQLELTALGAALDAGVPYVSACEDADTLEAMLDRAPQRCEASPRRDESGARGGAEKPGAGAPATARAIAVVGMSWSPGLSNLLAMAAAQRFDHLDAIRISWSVSRRDEPTAALARVLAAWSGDAEVIEGGRRGLRPAATRPRRCFFPEPMGWRRVSLARGAEVLTLPAAVGDLNAFHVLGGTDDGPASSLARAAARCPVMPGGIGRGLGLLTRSVAAAAPGRSRGDGWSGLRVDVEGLRAMGPGTETYGVVDRLDNLESAPLVVASLLLGSGEVTGAGVAPPESAFDPARFLAGLAKRGVRAARLVR